MRRQPNIVQVLTYAHASVWYDDAMLSFHIVLFAKRDVCSMRSQQLYEQPESSKGCYVCIQIRHAVRFIKVCTREPCLSKL
jgi:hypothetical protein